MVDEGAEEANVLRVYISNERLSLHEQRDSHVDRQERAQRGHEPLVRHAPHLRVIRVVLVPLYLVRIDLVFENLDRLPGSCVDHQLRLSHRSPDRKSVV